MKVLIFGSITALFLLPGCAQNSLIRELVASNRAVVTSTQATATAMQQAATRAKAAPLPTTSSPGLEPRVKNLERFQEVTQARLANHEQRIAANEKGRQAFHSLAQAKKKQRSAPTVPLDVILKTPSGINVTHAVCKSGTAECDRDVIHKMVSAIERGRITIVGDVCVGVYSDDGSLGNATLAQMRADKCARWANSAFRAARKAVTITGRIASATELGAITRKWSHPDRGKPMFFYFWKAVP
jgi:hypothetical protein